MALKINDMNIDVKYKKWLSSLNHKYLNLQLVEDCCNKHKKLGDSLPIEYRDIFKFKTVDEFVSYIDDYESKNDLDNSIKKNGSLTVYDSDDILIKYVFKWEAMKIYGRGSRWCISSDDRNVWDNYIKKGSLFFVVFLKKLSHISNFKKFVVELTSESVINVYDREDKRYYKDVIDLIGIDNNIFFKYRGNSIINNLFDSIISKDVINILVRNNAIICGGALSSMVTKNNVVDYDIWFSNIDNYKNTINDFNELIKLQSQFSSQGPDYTTNNAITYRIDGQKFQIINIERYSMGDIKHIVDQFDFKCVMCGVNMGNREIYMDDGFLNDNLFCKITINDKLRNKGNLLYRIVKYTKKGYAISPTQNKVALTILSKITEKDIEESMGY